MWIQYFAKKIKNDNKTEIETGRSNKEWYFSIHNFHFFIPMIEHTDTIENR